MVALFHEEKSDRIVKAMYVDTWGRGSSWEFHEHSFANDNDVVVKYSKNSDQIQMRSCGVCNENNDAIPTTNKTLQIHISTGLVRNRIA